MSQAQNSMPKFERIYRRCANPDCQSEFYVSEKDQAFLAREGFPLPKKCWRCRQAARREREAAVAEHNEAEIDRQWNEKVLNQPPSERKQWEKAWTPPTEETKTRVPTAPPPPRSRRK